jgi:hypothetical protein
VWTTCGRERLEQNVKIGATARCRLVVPPWGLQRDSPPHVQRSAERAPLARHRFRPTVVDSPRAGSALRRPLNPVSQTTMARSPRLGTKTIHGVWCVRVRQVPEVHVRVNKQDATHVLAGAAVPVRCQNPPSRERVCACAISSTVYSSQFIDRSGSMSGRSLRHIVAFHPLTVFMAHVRGNFVDSDDSATDQPRRSLRPSL